MLNGMSGCFQKPIRMIFFFVFGMDRGFVCQRILVQADLETISG